MDVEQSKVTAELSVRNNGGVDQTEVTAEIDERRLSGRSCGKQFQFSAVMISRPRVMRLFTRGCYSTQFLFAVLNLPL